MQTSPDRTAWLLERRAGIGASDVAGVLDVSPWASPFSVWADKVGLADLDSEASEAMILGRDLEPVISSWFTGRTGLHVTAAQQMAWHPVDPFFATLDGVVVESNISTFDAALGTFESKYTADEPWLDVPHHYWLQCQWAMHCTQLDHCWVAVMHMPFGRPRFEIYELHRDDVALASIVDRCRTFWNDYVETGKPPPTDGHPATRSALAGAWLDPQTEPHVDLTPLADRVADLVALRESIKQLDEQLAAVEAEIKVALGNHTEGQVDGHLAISWRAQRRTLVDVERVRADHGDAYDRSQIVRVLRTHGRKP